MNEEREETVSRVLARIHGKVQGVFFRASTERHARSLGLTGWVRNRADGTVELEAEGSRTACEALVEYCRQGPPAARVDSVQLEWIDPTGSEQDFVTRWHGE